MDGRFELHIMWSFLQKIDAFLLYGRHKIIFLYVTRIANSDSNP